MDQPSEIERSTDATPPAEWAVELRGVGKRFPGVVANHDINVAVARGTIHAIVGENGAGKSTLMKSLYGMHTPDEGEIVVFGESRRFNSPSAAIAAGIGMVHQHFMLADNFTVIENVVLGAEPGSVVIDYGAARKRYAELASLVNLDASPDDLVADLGVGDRQRIEILKALYRGAEILILDEPTAVLVPQEVDELFETMTKLARSGTTIIFISHKLDEVIRWSDAITVIRSGTTVDTVLPSAVTRKSLGTLMVGTELPEPGGRVSEIRTEVRLEVRDLIVAGPGAKPAVDHVSFSVRSGEVLGIAGVEGNGQSELCEAILGLVASQGSVTILDTDANELPTGRRKSLGVGYIPFDRHRDGLLLDAPLWENTLLGREDEPEFRRGPLLSPSRAAADAKDVVERFDVRTPSVSVPAFALSGGNQQKLIVGRELEDGPGVLIAAHPTRGVDIGAQAAIWDELRRVRDDGLAVLLVSADLDELIGLSDRILVLYEGAVTAELDPDEITAEVLGTYMTGGEVAA